MRSIISGLISAVLFLVLFLVFKWALPISFLLSLGVYFGTYLVSKPALKIGVTPLEKIDNGEEIKELYDSSVRKMENITNFVNSIKNFEIKEKSRELNAIGIDILNYLKRNPEKIGKSRYFLEYYLSTSEKILKNYLELESGNISSDKFSDISEKTKESIDLLIQVFKNHRDGFYTDNYIEIEVENELLKKTIRLGGE